MRVSSVEDLQALRQQAGLERVDLRMDQLLQGNLPLYAARFALWSLREGGTLHVHAPTTLASVSVVTGRWAFQLLVMMFCKALDGWGEVIAHDLQARTLVCRRTRAPLQRGPWSAAVMFSGSAGEVSGLKKCLGGLLAQPEIREGGQVLVCGPAAGEALVDVGGAGGVVQYLAVETPERAGRFMIGEKKNIAIRALRHERVLVCHTRIVLREGCLAAMPAEFDLITPRVWVQGAEAMLPYLDLGLFATDSAALYSDKASAPCHYDRARWLHGVAQRYPYIDGALFCVRKSLAQRVALSDSIGWGEAEDSEWALRLVHGGRLVELAPQAHAESTSCKTPRYARWGHLEAYRLASDWAQHWRAARAHVGRWLGV